MTEPECFECQHTPPIQAPTEDILSEINNSFSLFFKETTLKIP
jgi:hypothetical protein